MGKRKTQDTSAEPNEYEADGGFVADAPKSKKPRPSKNDKLRMKKEAKKNGAPVSGEKQVDKSGEVYWEVGIYISDFCSRMRVM